MADKRWYDIKRWSGILGAGMLATALATASVANDLSSTEPKIAGGRSYSLALDENGYVWATGYNKYGQLGNGSVNSSSTPVLSKF